MAGIPTANAATESLDALRGRWTFTLARLKGDPRGAPFVAAFAGFGPTWDAADAQDMALADAVSDARAGAVLADGALDRLVDQVTAAIYGGKKVNVNLPLHQLYFGGATPSAFKRPVLGAQLAGMQKWPAKLAAAAEPALSALAPAATAAFDGATAAAKALSDALAARESFGLGGPRKKAFDAFNALCATTYGGLKTFVHNNPQLDLPAGYAESFFEHATAAGGSAANPATLEGANALVARLEQKLGRARSLQADLQAKQTSLAAAQAAHAKAVADEKAAKQAVAAAKTAERAAAAAARKAKPKKR